MSRLVLILLVLAVALFAAFGVAHLLGGRGQTAFVLGDPTTDAVLGGFYLLSWLAAVVVAPILALSAGWLALLERLEGRRQSRRGQVRPALLVGLVAIGLVIAALAEGGEEETWTTLQPGLELAVLDSPVPSKLGDSRVRVLRVDPARFELVLAAASALDGRTRTAREWAADQGLVAAINASMYREDHRTSVALMRTREHVNNGRLSKDRTVLAFDRLDASAPPVAIIDRDCDDLDRARERYGTLIQSIRMVSCDGRNVWSQQDRRWSHAAIGIDGSGRPLLIHARSPWSTHDFIEILRGLPLDLARLQYAEGGPEAQLWIGAGRDLELYGSFETGFYEDDSNAVAWPVPNVVGVRPLEAGSAR